MLLLFQAAVLTATVSVAIALSLPALMLATRGWPNAGFPMRLAWLLSWLVQFYVTTWSAVVLAVDLLVAYGFVA